ncbi:PH domain-containing protein [Croceicoccus sediminis]|uniref:PH domain-containing protein n=1 Tax=Croceicoccus sediminis TaxID=2571150 RepID=UPI00118389CE|nr:PH domain-containing protein [Croceicoccus sediminis]
MNEQNEDLTLLDPRHITVLRIEALLGMVPILIGAVVVELVVGLPTGLIIVPALLVTALFTFPLPRRRYRRKGYSTTMDRLRYVKGWFRRSDTVVPFGRVQHIDVKEGLVERWFGLATLVVHTAGTHNASVSVPGLSRETAIDVREAIAARIRRDTM